MQTTNEDTSTATLAELKNRLEELEQRTLLVHPNFWTRAFAVYGLSTVAGLAIGIPLFLFCGLIGLMSGQP